MLPGVGTAGTPLTREPEDGDRRTILGLSLRCADSRCASRREPGCSWGLTGWAPSPGHQPAGLAGHPVRVVIQPRIAGPTYGEVFGETELMERALVTRVFSFRYASRVSMQSEDLTIRREEADSQRQIERVLDELARQEVINTGVILSP